MFAFGDDLFGQLGETRSMREHVSSVGDILYMTTTPHDVPHDGWHVAVSQQQSNSGSRTMEDAAVAITNFGGNPSQGYFAVFDGHGGDQVSSFAATTLHLVLVITLN